MDYRTLTYGTLDEVIAGVCLDLDEGEEHYEKYLKWALDMHRDWNMDSAKQVKTVEIAMNSFKAIDWPKDYLDWCKIGVRHKDTIYTFVNDNNIPLAYDKDEKGNPLPHEGWDDEYDTDDLGSRLDQSAPVVFYTNSYGEDLGKLYGRIHTGSALGFFRVDREQRRIQFKTRINSGSKIYLEYLGDGFDPCKNSLVHPYAHKLYEYFIHWQRALFSKRYDRAKAMDMEAQYWNEFWRVQYRMFEFTPELVIEASRGGYSLLPKT